MFTVLLTTSLNSSHVANWSHHCKLEFCLMRGGVVSVSTNMFSMPFLSSLQIGVLDGGNGACSTCYRLLQEQRFCPMFTFCLRCDVLSSWSFCKTVPLFDSLFGDTFRLKRLSIPIIVQMSLENTFILLSLHCTIVMPTRFVVQLEVFAAPNGSPLGLPVFK